MIGGLQGWAKIGELDLDGIELRDDGGVGFWREASVGGGLVKEGGGLGFEIRVRVLGGFFGRAFSLIWGFGAGLGQDEREAEGETTSCRHLSEEGEEGNFGNGVFEVRNGSNLERIRNEKKAGPHALI